MNVHKQPLKTSANVAESYYTSDSISIFEHSLVLIVQPVAS